MGYQTIIFDLGNVLVSFSHEKMFHQIAHITGLSPKYIQNLLIDHRIGHQYERGLLSNEEIYQIIQEKAPHSFLLPDLLYAASSIFSPRTDMETLAQNLKEKGYQLIIISNTFEPHFTFLKENYPFLTIFDHIILSFEIGIAKPERAIFEWALQKGKSKSSECFFIDDLLDNVHAAESLGIRSHHFTSPPRLMSDLIQLGII